MSIAFDTLEYARRLRQIGFDEKQAEGMTQALATAMTDTLATKQDLSELQVLLKADIRDVQRLLKADIREVQLLLQAEIREVHLRVKADMAELEARLESRLTLRLGGLMVAGIGIVSALVKLL